MLRSISNSLLALIYPQQCVLCGASVEERRDGVACDACWNQTKIFSAKDALCAKCGAFLSDRLSTGSSFCLRCAGHAYNSAHAIGIYEKALAATILNLKRRPELAFRIRTMLLGVFLQLPPPAATLIVPVPLSRKRMLERGFNQAEVIASFLSQHARVRMSREILFRTTHTRIHRAAMDQKAREKTVKKAFQLTESRSVASSDILLIDDVFTSGATASACAEVLKNGGARSVTVLTLGRAVLRS